MLPGSTAWSSSSSPRAAAGPSSPRWSRLPRREGQSARSKTSSGTFEFARPNRFRFQYQKPFEQTIVADGQTLWLYDADLKQVTARKQSQVLASTPAALIASAPDLGALRKDFTLEAAGEKDGLQWVQATPKAREGQLHSMKVGFRGNELAALEIQDSFGQRSMLTFTRMELNAAVGPEAFQLQGAAGGGRGAAVARPLHWAGEQESTGRASAPGRTASAPDAG